MIDANKQRSFMLDAGSDFKLEPDDDHLEWDAAFKVLRFRSSRKVNDLPEDRTEARLLANQAPVTFDQFGTWATFDTTENSIIAGGVLEDPIEILTLPAEETITDMAMNTDGILYAVSRDVAGISRIYLVNRLGSKEEGKKEAEGYDAGQYDTEVVKMLQTESGGQPDRIVALGKGGALLLDRENGQFWQVVGEPVRDQPRALYTPDTPRPCEDFPAPQQLITRSDLQLPENGEAISMASNPKGEVAVLLFPQEAETSAEVVLIKDGKMSAAMPLSQAGAPFSIGWMEDQRWGVLFNDLKEAIVYPIPFMEDSPQKPLSPTGYRYPLNWGYQDRYKNCPFCNGLAEPVRYPSTDRSGRFRLRPLYHLSFSAYPTSAEVEAKKRIDSGRPGTIWHRLYLEARLPKGTGINIFLAASDDLNDPDDPAWMEHQFGGVEAKADVPKGAWLKDASEVPYYKGHLYCSPEKNQSGLFTVLIQRPGYKVRSLKGRYLKIKVKLIGNGHESPEIAAIRIYGPRFSYLDNYLPELYRETLTRTEADNQGRATGSDFLQRFLCLFESLLTPLEDKVAASYMVTNPLSAPSDALDWLSGWVNMELEPALPEVQKRLYIKEATKLYRLRGTMKGLALALNLATNDGVKKGDIVLIEDFRFRRTFATILGADLSIENDPLLMGRIPNANSFVGDTLILGEESRKEFLALYARDFEKEGDEQEIIDNFYTRLANRLTVLVHQHTHPEELLLIRRIVRLEIPAHIDFRIVPASKPLLIGLYSLVGMDTYLQEEPQRSIARLGHSYLGRDGFIRKLPVLDDRLEP